MKLPLASLLAVASLFIPTEALAHGRHYHPGHHHHSRTTFGLVCVNGHCTFGVTNRRNPNRIRISENCVYNIRKDKTICRY